MAVPKTSIWDGLPSPPLLHGYFILVATDNLPEVSISTNEVGLGASSASFILPGRQQKECWLLIHLRGKEDLPEHSENTLNIPFKQAGKELPPCLPVVVESWKDLGWKGP